MKARRWSLKGSAGRSRLGLVEESCQRRLRHGRIAESDWSGADFVRELERSYRGHRRAAGIDDLGVA